MPPYVMLAECLAHFVMRRPIGHCCSVRHSFLYVGVSAALQSRLRRQAYCDGDGASWVGPIRGVDGAADVHRGVGSRVGGNNSLGHSRAGI